MSFEGYNQGICTEGHYFETGLYDSPVCDCGHDPAWINTVDETNGPGQGLLDHEHLHLLMIKPSGTADGEPLYRPPTDEEFRDWEGGLRYVNGKFLFTPYSKDNDMEYSKGRWTWKGYK